MATAQPVAVYDAPHQMEPMLPRERVAGELRARSDEIWKQSLLMRGGMHASVLATIQGLVRAMNSYYSNRIEGQSTHPVYIAQAQANHFHAEPGIAQRQRLALAHIAAEVELEQLIAPGRPGGGALAPLSADFAIQAHRALYERVPPEERGHEGGGVPEPGVLRDQDVAVQRHHAPTHAALERLLQHFDRAYARHWLSNELLYVTACAHHRMAWIHPFVDGNGRTARLQTHAALWSVTGGLWSVNRGLARQRDEYYVHLSEADMARQGDLDGRGNLSERMLVAWCAFFLSVCEDQVGFMSRMLDLGDIRMRMAQLVAVRAQEPGQALIFRPQVALALQHLFAAGPVSRGEFQQLTGLTERTAGRVLKGLLEDGVVVSASRHAPVHLSFQLKDLPWLFPGLYPEAAQPPA